MYIHTYNIYIITISNVHMCTHAETISKKRCYEFEGE